MRHTEVSKSPSQPAYDVLPAGGKQACPKLTCNRLSAGAVSFGIVSLGAVAVGDFSVGALAVGKYFALGDHATAMIALGDSHAAGSVYQRIGDISAESVSAVKAQLDAVVPSLLNWAKDLILLFL